MAESHREREPGAHSRCGMPIGWHHGGSLFQRQLFAPNLKGRPRKKKPSSQKRDTQSANGLRDSNEDSDGKGNAKAKCDPKTTMAKPKSNNSNCKNLPTDEKSKVAAGEECGAEEQTFLVTLYKYMKERNTPIERIPYLGFKQINLWTMFQAAQSLGGYEAITARRQWKQIYDELGGNPGSTSAATCTRRHYERLILPYERYIKGEEDKPLPPVKPRKQECSPQESESKMRAAGAKRKAEQNRKVKRERDTNQKVKELSEAIATTEESREMAKWSAASALSREGAVTQVENGENEQNGCDVSEGSEGKGDQAKDKVNKANGEQVNGKEAETLSLHQGLATHSRDEAAQSPVESKAAPASSQNLEAPQHPADKLADGLQEKAAGEVSTGGEGGDVPDRGPSATPPDTANASVPADQTPKEEADNGLGDRRPESRQRQAPGQAGKANPSPEPLKEREELVVTKTEACSSYLPLVYSRGHPGIMSPLAKKKFLSQVSGTLSNSYPIGAPLPIHSSKKSGENCEEVVTTESNLLQGSTPDQLAINRPSVIQHAHSFQKRNADERGEAFKHEGLNKLSDSEAAYLAKHHLICSDSFKSGAPYPFTSNLTDNESKGYERKGCPPSHVSSFLADFYSSPHLHSLYRHTEHHLNNDHTAKHLSSIMKDKSSSFAQNKNQDTVYLSYLSTLHRQEMKCAVKPPTEEQPTDLSLPKLKKTLPKNSSSSSIHLPSQLDLKSTIAGTQLAHTDCNPKACRVPPMPVPSNIKNTDAIPPPSAKLEEAVHPTLASKGGSQLIGSSKPIKRSREGVHNGSGQSPEKKLRAVSPLPPAKDPALKEKPSDLEGECSKNLPPGIILEGHKFSLPTPIFPGVYPGAFVSQVQDMCDGLGSGFPVDYAHPLQYLKNQAVLSPLMQPLAIHSFMIPAMQRQILASTGASPQLYRHLSAAAAPVAASYGELLHHSLYPLASLNPQVAYSTSPISSLHPSAKL
ncbi:aT-rich interactive domain-containing protein 5B isoform X2 [Mustelus asterias]